jgi:hypothetical protein
MTSPGCGGRRVRRCPRRLEDVQVIAVPVEGDPQDRIHEVQRRQTSAFGTLLPLQQAAIDAALNATVSALRLQELRTVTCAEG